MDSDCWTWTLLISCTVGLRTVGLRTDAAVYAQLQSAASNILCTSGGSRDKWGEGLNLPPPPPDRKHSECSCEW